MSLESYQGLEDRELQERISSAKSKLGRDLVILGHHYQREEVIAFADFKGDSFGLSKRAGETDARYIVFCGVHFMAEAARILARPDQHVFHPDFDAGCPLADMASIDDVEDAWAALGDAWDIKKVIPVTYINSHAALKAFCGRNGGLVCTSTNAPKAWDWAFARGEKVFFFPDEHLGRNTARGKGIPREELVVWNPEDEGRRTRDEGRMMKCTIMLWKGYCHVHTYFQLRHVKEARKKYPGCKIVVHPECTEDVVMASDAAASTEGICKFVREAPEGSTIVIGTEINLVTRLAHENPSKKVIPLARSLCPNMFKVSLSDLCWTLESLIDDKPVNEIVVKEPILSDSRLALRRMLEAS